MKIRPKNQTFLLNIIAALCLLPHVLFGHDVAPTGSYVPCTATYEIADYVNAEQVEDEAYHKHLVGLIAQRYPRTKSIKVIGGGLENIVFDIETVKNQRSQHLVLLVPKRPWIKKYLDLVASSRDTIRAIERLDSDGAKYVADLYGSLSLGEGKDKIPALALRRAEGNLHSVLNEFGPKASKRKILTAWLQIAKGIRALHKTDRVHRDLKPGNILVYRQKDGSFILKIADFGLSSKDGGYPKGFEDRSSGTPTYMSPEQLDGGPGTVPNDIYSLEVVFKEMLLGRPIGSFDFKEPTNHIRFEPVNGFGTWHFLDDLPDSIRAQTDPVLLRLVDRHYSSVDDVISAIERELRQLVDIPASVPQEESHDRAEAQQPDDF